MKKPEVFEENLNKATEIRTVIQDELRSDYNSKKKLFKRVTELDANEALKHLVDMRHYKDGGYPNPNSLPKHIELLNKFIVFLKFFNLLGWDKEFIHDYLAEFGVEVKITEGSVVDDYEIPEEGLDDIKAFAGFDVKTFKEFLTQTIEYCDDLQGQICGYSNQIKRDMAEEVKDNCEVKKGHFTNTVMFQYKKNKEIEKTTLKGKKDNLIKLKDKLDIESNSYNDMMEIKGRDL